MKSFVGTTSNRHLIMAGLLSVLLVACISCHEHETVDDGTADLNLSGSYNFLFIDSASFNALDTYGNGIGDRRGNLYFRYFVEQNLWNMHGWTWKFNNPTGSQFDPLPNVKLKIGPISIVNFGDGSYFGDFLLPKTNINSIKGLLLSRQHKYVVFVPFMDPVDNEFKWKIATSANEPSVSSTAGINGLKKEIKGAGSPSLMFQNDVEEFIDFEETGFIANPIPPKRIDQM